MEDKKNNNTLYDKGIILLKNALKKYEDGDFESADNDRKLANEIFDKAHTEEKYDDNILYGENRNFGIIYNVVNENTKTAYKTQKGLKEIGVVLKHIKNNKILKEQFEIYSSIEKNQIKNDTMHYVNEAVAMLPSYNKKEIFKENDNLIKIIRNNNLNECINIPEEKLNLYEAIEFILLNKKNITNIDSFKSSKNTILEYVNKHNKVPSLSEEKNVKEATEVISEEEKKLTKELNEGNKEEIFNRYKTETMKMISEQISLSENLNDKIDWNSMLTRVMIKQYDENKILEDIYDFINVQNIINE